MLIIIASDSRGRGFDQFLQKAYPFPSNWKLSLICRPGGPIERLRKEVELTQKSMSKVLQTHIGFFCRDLQFHQKNQACTWYRTIIQHIQSSFKTQPIPFSFQLFPPVSIKKFKEYQFKRRSLQSSQFSLEDTISQQICLEDDIREVILNICKINSENKVSTIRLDKDISKTSINGKNRKKINKFTYDNFYDGIQQL